MIKLIQILFCGIASSLFFFPMELRALPGVNSKMIMAVMGAIVYIFGLVKKRTSSIPINLLVLTGIAAAVSLASLLSITVNQTPDYIYVTYIFSFYVWLAAAYFVCWLIAGTHGRIDVRLVTGYLVAVCIFQCITAIWFNQNQALGLRISNVLYFGQDVSIELKRLYGLGATLDVAGIRFAVVLTAISFFLAETTERLNQATRIAYTLSFLVITIIGNMIARTTIIGTAIGIVFLLATALFAPSSDAKSGRFLTWAGLGLATVLICIFLYNNSPQAHRLMRFAFEGFFSLAEKGRWEVASNDILKSMVVFPETLHTWIIGDGYFVNSRYDINYLGDATDEGFYMGTDVGYLRFIFYFGIIGLIPMMGIIVYSAAVCMRQWKKQWLLFAMALLVGLTVWFKVSTDIFLFFALFLAAATLRQPGKESAQEAAAPRDV